MDPVTKELDVPWNQAHFAAWCIVSSPLTLGLNLLSPELEKIIPFITNKVSREMYGTSCVRHTIPSSTSGGHRGQSKLGRPPRVSCGVL